MRKDLKAKYVVALMLHIEQATAKLLPTEMTINIQGSFNCETKGTYLMCGVHCSWEFIVRRPANRVA